jgi:hypothetical protein
MPARPVDRAALDQQAFIHPDDPRLEQSRIVIHSEEGKFDPGRQKATISAFLICIPY